VAPPRADDPRLDLDGVRTDDAAAAAAASQVGYAHSYNILEGFEGDKNAQGHRASVGGWKFAGLPWVQS